MDLTATLSVQEAADPGTTWIEERISFSLGNGPVMRWVDRWLVNPVFGVLMRLKSRKAMRRLGRAIAHADPGVMAGTLRVEVSQWRPIVWDRFSPSSIELASGPVSVSYSPELGA
jgi:hypothetical protein